MEAGGHIGPVSTSVLIQEILPHVTEVPIFVAGGIGRGEAMLSYLELGASGVQLGTRFVCAHESIAHPRFKQALHPRRRARRDPLGAARSALSRHPGSGARQSDDTQRFIETQRALIRAGRPRRCVAKGCDSSRSSIFWAGALRRAVIDGDVETGSVMAGQSVGMVTREQSTREILDEFVAQALAVLERRATPGTEAVTEGVAHRGAVMDQSPALTGSRRLLRRFAGHSWRDRAARRSGSTRSFR